MYCSTLIGGYTKQVRPTKEYKFELDDKNMPTGKIFHDTAATRPVERPAILYEMDHLAPKKKQWQFCISIDFLESRFKFDIENTSTGAIRALLEKPEMTFDDTRFPTNDDDLAMADIKRQQLYRELLPLTECQDIRSPMIEPIRKVLNMPILERSPYEKVLFPHTLTQRPGLW